MKVEQIVTTYEELKAKTEIVTLECTPELSTQELHLLNVYPSVRYQKLKFFGGAITDSVADTLEKMSYAQQCLILNSYFGDTGIGYRAIRTHIDSCDFATQQYAAVIDEDDVDLKTFSIEHDITRNIRWIKEANKIAGTSLPVMLSPWSPPAFMKTNGSRTGGGRLKKTCYAAWAEYICKYIKAYQQEGINVSAISIQNEPNAVQSWDSCLYSSEEEREFLSNYLNPSLVKHNLTHIAVYIWDHNKERLFDRAQTVITEKTDSMISGIAFHWYSGDHFDAVRLVKERFPDKDLVFSEGCIEYSRHNHNQLANAQIYAHDMIGNLNSGMNAFYDWNICLNQSGGPNYAKNYCESPILCDTSKDQIEYKLSFRYISHFSRFIKPGAFRIATTIYTDKLENTAFQNSDGSIAIILLNREDNTYPLIVRLLGKQICAEIPPNSISTILINE